MRFEGSLDTFSLGDIATLLASTRKTGALHLRREGQHGVLRFADGAVTDGSSDVSRQTLARRLIGTGLVDDDGLDAAVAQATRSDVAPIGAVRALRDAGSVDEQELADTAHEHVVDTAFDLLCWPDGDFSFVWDDFQADDLGLSWPAEVVIGEARQRLDTWEQLGDAAPPTDAVVALAPMVSADPHELSVQQWALLAAIDGRRTVGEVARLTGRGMYAAVTGLAALVERGLVHTGADAGVAALVRRQQLLAPLEAEPGAAEPPSAAAGLPLAVAEDTEPAPAEALDDFASWADDVEPAVPEGQPSADTGLSLEPVADADPYAEPYAAAEPYAVAEEYSSPEAPIGRQAYREEPSPEPAPEYAADDVSFEVLPSPGPYPAPEAYPGEPAAELAPEYPAGDVAFDEASALAFAEQTWTAGPSYGGVAPADENAGTVFGEGSLPLRVPEPGVGDLPGFVPLDSTDPQGFEPLADAPAREPATDLPGFADDDVLAASAGAGEPWGPATEPGALEYDGLPGFANDGDPPGPAGLEPASPFLSEETMATSEEESFDWRADPGPGEFLTEPGAPRGPWPEDSAPGSAIPEGLLSESLASQAAPLGDAAVGGLEPEGAADAGSAAGYDAPTPPPSPASYGFAVPPDGQASQPGGPGNGYGAASAAHGDETPFFTLPPDAAEAENGAVEQPGREEEPQVSRSLLMRLIAGVQGL